MKTLLIATAALMFAGSAQGHVHVTQVEIVELRETGPDEYVLRFRYTRDSQGKANQVEVHLRYKAQRLSRGLRDRYDLALFREAINLLRAKIRDSKQLTLGLLSSTGYLPICRQRGKFRSEALEITTLRESRERIVTLVHSDLGDRCSRN